MMLKVSGVSLHYKIVGEGTPILCIHGWGGSSSSLMPLAQDLKDYCSSYLIDLPGFGKSHNPPPSWGIDEYVELLKTFTQQVGMTTPISVIGHSFGGALALTLAARYPNLVSKLVVCAPSWHRHASTVSSPRRISKILHRFPLVRRILYKVLYPRSDLMRNPQLESNFKRIVSQDLTDVVKSVGQNTLIIWGKEDTYVPVTDAMLLQSYIPHSILSVFPGMRHDLPIRHSHLITSSIHTFLTTKAGP